MKQNSVNWKDAVISAGIMLLMYAAMALALPVTGTYTNNVYGDWSYSGNIEPFQQYYNVRLLLMCAGPIFYYLRNKPNWKRFVLALAVIIAVFSVLYVIAYLALPLIIGYHKSGANLLA